MPAAAAAAAAATAAGGDIKAEGQVEVPSEVLAQGSVLPERRR
jgi:hypothetical protein